MSGLSSNDLSQTWTLFCVGCNERFPVQGAASQCPNCGREITFNDTSAQDTQLLDKADSESSFREVAHGENTEDDLIGRVIHVYECISKIGQGGMGRVYLAKHRDLERQCALKILSPRRAKCDEEFVARFLEEGRSAAALVHPNIVTIHAVGQTDKVHFLEMEFVAGRSLQQLIKEEGRLTNQRALSLTAGIAEALAAAHREGIIHRDVKPDNVLLTRQGQPKIGDFGLAKRVLNHSGRPVADGLCGTPNFMAPELFRGEPASPASDVYALGVCLYLMLSGQLPHRAKTIAELRFKATTDEVPNIRDVFPDVSLEVAEAVAQMTDSTPGNRPQDATVALHLINAVLGQERDLATLLLEAFRDEPGVSWQRESQGYSVLRELENSRTQRVYIEDSSHSLTDRLLLFYSICCPAEERFYEEGLRLNSSMLHGSLSIREIDGRPHFVVVNTYPRSTVDPEEVQQTVMEVAKNADRVEEILTGNDRN